MSSDSSGLSNDIFIPEEGKVTRDSVWRWYQNVPNELALLEYSSSEKMHFREYYEEAGLLSSAKIDFFRAHFAESFTEAASYLLASHSQPTILDLGGGTGTQALYLALHGAKVTVVDMDRIALDILRKRVEWYSGLVGRELQVKGYLQDTHEFDYGVVAPIDGIYSMFAFNMMQPSDQLLSIITRHLGIDARLAIIDGNNRSWLARIVPSRQRAVWTPAEFACEVKQMGFDVDRHEGSIVLPPLVWKVLPYRIIKSLDRSLRGNWFCPISHQILARRNST